MVWILLQYNIKETKCIDHNKGNYHIIVLFTHFDIWPLTVCLFGQ